MLLARDDYDGGDNSGKAFTFLGPSASFRPVGIIAPGLAADPPPDRRPTEARPCPDRTPTDGR